MLLRKFAVVIGLLSVAFGYPSYSDLSKAIMSSMTNLWNEQQGQSPQDKIAADQFLIDYLYDGSSASASNEKQSESRVVESTPVKTKTTDVAKSNYMIYSRRRTKYPQTNYSKKQSTYNVKSTKKDRGPLYRALNGPNPVSFERLLHFYDYLDESYEDTSNSDPNCTKNIESMLGKFMKAITSVIKRPVVVNTNVCCPQTPPAQPNSDNLANPQPTTSKPPLLESLYTSLAQNSRYASNHKDIVEQLHRLLESIGHPREKDPDKKVNIPSTSENVPVQSLPVTTPISTTISLEKEIMQDTENSFPESTSTLSDVTSTTPPSQGTVTSAIEAKSAETETQFPSILDDNFYSTPPSTQLPPESQTYQTTDTTTGDGSSAEAATEADSTKLKRKKRQLLSKRHPKNVIESSIAQILQPKSVTTAPPSFQDIEYEDFVKNNMENTTSDLETLVLNRNPIVEHTNAALLDHEKKTQGEWIRPRKPSNCSESIGKPAQTETVNIEEIIKNPPDFIESIK